MKNKVIFLSLIVSCNLSARVEVQATAPGQPQSASKTSQATSPDQPQESSRISSRAEATAPGQAQSLEAKAPPSQQPAAKSMTPDEALLAAIMDDSAEKIVQAIKMGADKNKKIAEKSPISLAVSMKKINAAIALINMGSSLVGIGEDLIYKALQYSQLDLALLLAKKGFKSGSYTQRCMDMLISHNIDNAKNDEDLQPYFNLIIEFIKEGYDINDLWAVINDNFHRFSSDKRIKLDKIINFMVENGANVNYVTKDSAPLTPLLIAIRNNDGKLFKTLVNVGADINKTNNLETPISYAVRLGRPDMVELLIKLGAK